MAQRTLGSIVAAISRNTGGQVPFGEIVDAVANANKEIHTKYEWPWTRAEAQVQIQPSYTTGTVTIADQTAVANGTGVVWNTGWLYKRILLGNMDYPIQTFNSASQLTLKQTINQGNNFINAGYTIFQDMYPLPADCEFGGILLIANPLFRYKLKYIPVYTLETSSAYSRGMFNNLQVGFCDGGVDDVTHANLIRVTLPPGSAGELRIIYRRRPPAMTAMTDVSLLPESFDRALELLAEYYVRLFRQTPMPGWMEIKEEAYQLLNTMRRKMATTLTDNYSTYSAFPWAESQGASFSAGIAWVGPTPSI